MDSYCIRIATSAGYIEHVSGTGRREWSKAVASMIAYRLNAASGAVVYLLTC